MIEGVTKDSHIVLQYFNKLTNIPRCSGEEQNISNYLLAFAKEHNLEASRDMALNVIIKKEASKGYESFPPVVLQGHMDMVCEVEHGCTMDFSKDAIPAMIEGDYVIAPHTTLGADNGIAVAMILAILANDELKHPKIEALFTSDEEEGMTGAMALNPAMIESERLINLDSEEEGVFCVGCAGGKRNTARFKKEFKSSIKDEVFELQIKGLSGGHSGQAIDEGRGNAIRLLARLLFELNRELSFDLIDFLGGSKSNAIPRDAQAFIAIDAKDKKTFESIVHEYEAIFKDEYKITDPQLSIEIKPNKGEKALSDELSQALINYILGAPNGVSTMSTELDGQVESSTNLGIVRSNKDNIEVISQVRGSKASKVDEISSRNEAVAILANAEYSDGDGYPAWEYRENSPLRDLAIKTYKNIYGEAPLIQTIHGGLECGLFTDIFDNMDMISLGPSIYGVHAPGEKFSISSVERVFNYVVQLLEELK